MVGGGADRQVRRTSSKERSFKMAVHYLEIVSNDVDEANLKKAGYATNPP